MSLQLEREKTVKFKKRWVGNTTAFQPTFWHSDFKGCILALPELHEIQSVLLWASLEYQMSLAIRRREETLSLNGQSVGTRCTHHTQV